MGGGWGGKASKDPPEYKDTWLFVVLRDTRKFLCTHSSDRECGIPLSNCYRVDQ